MSTKFRPPASPLNRARSKVTFGVGGEVRSMANGTVVNPRAGAPRDPMRMGRDLRASAASRTKEVAVAAARALSDRVNQRPGKLQAKPSRASVHEVTREAVANFFWEEFGMILGVDQEGAVDEREAASSAADERIKETTRRVLRLADKASPSAGGVAVTIEFPDLTGTDAVGAVEEFAQQLPVLIANSQQEHYQQRVRSLLQAYPLPDPLGDAHLENYRDELIARQRYLQTVPCWTSKEVGDAARHANKNAGQTAYRWKNDGRIFSIPAGGHREVYPAFQFKDGQPRACIGEVLKHLKPHRTPWEIAQWFIAPNGWLDGDRPLDVLDEAEQDAALLAVLVDAAEQEVAANVG